MKNKAARIILIVAAFCLISMLSFTASPADAGGIGLGAIGSGAVRPGTIDYRDYLDVYLFLSESGEYYNYGYVMSAHAVPYAVPQIDSFSIRNFNELQRNLDALGEDESADVTLMQAPKASSGVSSKAQNGTLALTHEHREEILKTMEEFRAEIQIFTTNGSAYGYVLTLPVYELQPQILPETANGVVEKTARRSELFHSYTDTGLDFTEDPAYAIIVEEIERIKPEVDSSAVTPELMDVYYIDSGGLINQNGESISVYEINVRYHTDPIPAEEPKGYHLRGDCLWPDEKTYVFVYDGPMYMTQTIPVCTMSASELRIKYFTKEHLLEHGNRFEAAAWDFYEQYFNGAVDAKISLYCPVQYSRAIGPGSKDDFSSIPDLGERVVTRHEDWDPIYNPGDYWYTVDYDGLSALCYYNAVNDSASINTISVMRSDLVTFNGLHVGSTRTEVLKASDQRFLHDTELYPHTGDYLWVNYMSDTGLGYNLLFFFENDVVTEIVSENMFD
ncbi:MAG: hypothetical protein IKR93_02930 [Firmicutes bacterium]|nr:hypothetical protein [Bacillota bacterium]